MSRILTAAARELARAVVAEARQALAGVDLSRWQLTVRIDPRPEAADRPAPVADRVA